MYVWFKLLMLDHTQKLTFLSILKKFKNTKIQIIELKFCHCYQKKPSSTYFSHYSKTNHRCKNWKYPFFILYTSQQTCSKKVLQRAFLIKQNLRFGLVRQFRAHEFLVLFKTILSSIIGWDILYVGVIVWLAALLC